MKKSEINMARYKGIVNSPKNGDGKISQLKADSVNFAQPKDELKGDN